MGKPNEDLPEMVSDHPEEPQSELDGANSSSNGEITTANGVVEVRPIPPMNVYTINVGDQVDVLDSAGKWCEAEVTKIDRENHKMFASYIYWDRKFDEWIEDIPGRVAPLHTHTYYIGGRLKVGQRIEVLDERQEWLEAFVVEENESQVKIHYKNYHPKFDTWLDRSSPRIRPYGRSKFSLNMLPKSKRLLLWSTGSSLHAIPTTTTLIGKLPASSSTLVADGSRPTSSTGSGRVRYLEDDARTRKIANLSEQFHAYRMALENRQLSIVPVSGDGNCLFRAVAHQIYGDDRYHSLVRQKCMDYMESEADFFSQFVVGGKEHFHLYLQAKRMDGCWGDDPEIEAICELYNRPAEIWAYDRIQGARKLRTFHETSQYSRSTVINQAMSHHQSTSSSTTANAHRSHQSRRRSNQPEDQDDQENNNHNNNYSNNGSSNQRELDPAEEAENFYSNNSFDSVVPPPGSLPIMRLSYYGGGHYDSIVDQYHRYHLLTTLPGVLEDQNIAQSRRRVALQLSSREDPTGSTNSQLQQRFQEIEATNRAALDAAIQESRQLEMNREYDDLETCLALSMNTFQQEYPERNHLTQRDNHSSSSREESKVSSSNYQPNDELVALQGDVLRSIQEQSEREYLDTAILSSLTNNNHNNGKNPQDPTLTEEELLQQAILSSAKEAEQEDLRRATLASTSNIPFTLPPVEEDKDLELAMKLSSMTEEEALQYVLNQSLQQDYSVPSTSKPSATTTTTAPSSTGKPQSMEDLNGLTEEELLQLAMAESLQSAPSHTTTSISSNSRGQPVMIYGDDVDYDEDLMKAIQASLQK